MMTAFIIFPLNSRQGGHRKSRQSLSLSLSLSLFTYYEQMLLCVLLFGGLKWGLHTPWGAGALPCVSS